MFVVAALAVLCGLPQDDRPIANYPRDIELNWTAPAECPTAESVLMRLESLLAGPHRGMGLARVDAVVRGGDAAFEMEMTIRYEGVEDVREFKAAACADMAEAAAVVLAVSLEPGLQQKPTAEVESSAVPETTARPVIPEMLPEAVGPTEIPPVESVVPAPKTEVRSERVSMPVRPWRIAIMAQAGPEYGGLRAWTLALQGGVAIVWPHVRLEAFGTYLTPRVQQRLDGSGGHYQFVGGGVRVCGQTRPERWAFVGCAGAEAGALRVSPRGIENPRVHFGPFMGPSLGVGVIWHHRRLGVRAAAEVVGRVFGSRTRIQGEVFVEQFPVSFRGLLGFFVTLP